MNINELNAMPKALRILASQILAPDHIPATCLLDAANMIEALRKVIEETLEANRHLADGDDCTLKALKDAVGWN